MADVPQNSCKQTTRNSFELAESRRHPTANVENTWLSNLHENVNSANSQNAIIHSGTLPESRKRNLTLPEPLPLDAFCAQMAPHIFGNPNKALHDSAHPDMLCQALPRLGELSVDFMRRGEPSVDYMRPGELSVDLMRLEEPLVDFKRLNEPSRAFSRDKEPRSHWAVPSPKLTGLDNTVGPVPKISGYVFNTLQTNSAAHVPNTNMNLINEDTHICDLNLYETIFQNLCLVDSLSATTPDTNDYGVAPPTVITSREASTLLQVKIAPPIFTCFTFRFFSGFFQFFSVFFRRITIF